MRRYFLASGDCFSRDDTFLMNSVRRAQASCQCDLAGRGAGAEAGDGTDMADSPLGETLSNVGRSLDAFERATAWVWGQSASR